MICRLVQAVAYLYNLCCLSILLVLICMALKLQWCLFLEEAMQICCFAFFWKFLCFPAFLSLPLATSFPAPQHSPHHQQVLCTREEVGEQNPPELSYTRQRRKMGEKEGKISWCGQWLQPLDSCCIRILLIIQFSVPVQNHGFFFLSFSQCLFVCSPCYCIELMMFVSQSQCFKFN